MKKFTIVPKTNKAFWKTDKIAPYVYCRCAKKSWRCRELFRRAPVAEWLLCGGRNPSRQWIGAGAERLGLKSEVTREQFHALCENENPETGQRLTQRQLKEGQRRVFYDFTCSAPKSARCWRWRWRMNGWWRRTRRPRALRSANLKLSPQHECENRAAKRIGQPAISPPPRSRTRAAARLTRSCIPTSQCSTPRLMTANGPGKPCKRAACMTPSVTARRFIATNWRSGCNRSATGFNRPNMAFKLRASAMRCWNDFPSGRNSVTRWCRRWNKNGAQTFQQCHFSRSPSEPGRKSQRHLDGGSARTPTGTITTRWITGVEKTLGIGSTRPASPCLRARKSNPESCRRPCV